jgi:ribulose-5-phosphate 4-epimerase/fuculose-1-phosphate aldolase
LGQLDGVLLEQHGALTVGRTVAEAFVLMQLLERAARIQLQAMAANGGVVHCVSAEVAALTHAQWVGDGRTPEGQDEWPALLRELQSPAQPFLP